MLFKGIKRLLIIVLFLILLINTSIEEFYILLGLIFIGLICKYMYEEIKNKNK